MHPAVAVAYKTLYIHLSLQLLTKISMDFMKLGMNDVHYNISFEIIFSAYFNHNRELYFLLATIYQ